MLVPGRSNKGWLTPTYSLRLKRYGTIEVTGLRRGLLQAKRDGGIGAQPSALYSQWPLSYHRAELALIEAAAAQVTDGFTLSRHRGIVIVVQLVLLGLSDEFAGQIEEELLDIVGLFGRGLQIQHALSLSKVFSPLSENLSLLRQINFISCEK